jgi:hypothetical protein
MENNLMKHNINELKHLYNKTNDDFKKFFIKKVIEYKINIGKQNKSMINSTNSTNINNDNNKKDTLDDLINYSNDDNISSSEKSEESDNKNKIEDKYLNQIKFDSTNNKLLERLNIESNFRSTDKKNSKKQFVSPFAEDNLYNEQFANDKYIESIKKVN